jgi:hypothetical protein
MSNPSDSIYLHRIETNINRIDQNINNIYTMLNIISNSMIINQMNEIRRPRLNTSIPNIIPNLFSSNTTQSPLNTPIGPNVSVPSTNNSTQQLPNPLTNLFSTMFRNEGFPSGGIAMGFGNMDISVQNSEEQNIVISHHNIFNNTKIKLKTYNQNEGIELEQCTICLADIENNQIIREINKCKHEFHVVCADKWFEEHITCPHCRQDIRIEMVN